MCTTEQTFAWVGAIVINIAFISLIAWGASTIWWVGFAISAVYTLLLFGLARAVDKRSGWDADATRSSSSPPGGAACSCCDEEGRRPDESTDDESVEHDETDRVATAIAALPGSTTSPSERRMPVLANLLYGLFALALGVTGFFLPMNLRPGCGDGESGYTTETSSGHWSTDLSTLPSDVQSWASSAYRRPSATFAYIARDGHSDSTLLFEGYNGPYGDYGSTLWSVTTGSEPSNFTEIRNPSQFVPTGTGWGCFVGTDALQNSVVGCSDGKVLRTNEDSDTPYDLLVDSDHALWFKGYPPLSSEMPGKGTLIFSIEDYDTMEATLHSTYTKSGDNDPYYAPEPNSDDFPDCSEGLMEQSILAIFTTSLPIVIASLILWLKRTAPSMAITAYIGLTSTATFIYQAAIESTYEMNNFWGEWFTVSGAIYVIILSDLTHCKREDVAREPLIWGVNFGSLAFFIGMIILTGIFSEWGQAWSWLVFNLFAIAPLGVLGLAHGQVFLLVLSAIGWLMTTVKIASALAGAAGTADVPIYFVVLAFSGLLIAGAGWWLNKKQGEIQSVLGYQMERLSLSKRIFPEQQQGIDEREQRGRVNLEISTSPMGVFR